MLAEITALGHSNSDYFWMISMAYRILFATGGTGGHLFPALAAAEQLRQRWPDCELLFCGGALTNNRFFAGHPFHHAQISCAPLSFKNPLKSLGGLFPLIKGFRQSAHILSTFSPHLIMGFGSFYTFPLLATAKLKQIPFLLHEANCIPGRVNRLLERYACCTAIFFPAAAQRLFGQTALTKMPLRWCKPTAAEELEQKQKALAYFGWSGGTSSEQLPTLLIFGGSQGAQAINSLLANASPIALQGLQQKLRILHFTGCPKAAELLRQRYAEASISCYVQAFEKRMDLAWLLADLALCRSGASTIAEALEFEVPAIFIPFPHAQDNHQQANALFVSQQLDAAYTMLQKEVTPEKVLKLIQELFSPQNRALLLMRQRLAAYHSHMQQQPELADIATRYLLRGKNSL